MSNPELKAILGTWSSSFGCGLPLVPTVGAAEPAGLQVDTDMRLLGGGDRLVVPQGNDGCPIPDSVQH